MKKKKKLKIQQGTVRDPMFNAIKRPFQNKKPGTPCVFKGRKVGLSV